MYIIGLTGGIATGKSTAAATLRSFGAYVVDADAISRALTMPGGAAADDVLRRFHTLDRKALGRIVFSDPKARADLEAIVHPKVKESIDAALANHLGPIAVLDVPLLYESGMEALANEVWVTHVPQAEQIRRLMARDRLTEAEAMIRINSQMPTEEKLRRADAGIDTSGPKEETAMRIRSLWQAARERAALS